MIIGLILAAGKGTRMKSEETGKNKTSLTFNGKPIIQYGVDLFKATTDKVALLVGAFSESLKEVITDSDILFLEQKELLGTGQAVTTSLEQLHKLGYAPTELVIGYGDHMMFYSPERIKEMIRMHREKKAVITMITTKYENPNELAWGRVIRNGGGSVNRIVEQKDATDEEKKCTELNAGIYVFSGTFLNKNKHKLTQSPVTHEFYLTEFIAIANKNGQVVLPYPIPFSEVGIGINSFVELEKSQELHKQVVSSK